MTDRSTTAQQTDGVLKRIPYFALMIDKKFEISKANVKSLIQYFESIYSIGSATSL